MPEMKREKWNMKTILRNKIASLIVFLVILALAGCAGAPVKPNQIPPEPQANLLDRLKDEYTAYPTNYALSYSNAGLALL
jgi:hypothetical protein